MTLVRVKGFKIFRDRHGKQRCYHRTTGKPVNLRACPIGSPEFFAECARIADMAKLDRPAKLGTLGSLIDLYRAHTAFQGLAPKTQTDYQRVFDYLRPIKDTALVNITRPLIVRIRDKAHETKGFRSANYVKQVLSVLLGSGAERGYVSENMAIGVKRVKRPKSRPRANRPWSEQECEAVITEAGHLAPAIGLMMYCGLGPKDALILPKSAVKGGALSLNRTKTGEPVYWPVPEPLLEILKTAEPHDAVTVAANSRGLPWTIDGFRASWAKLRTRLQAEERIGAGLTLYGLRHTVAVLLRELGYNERNIADALGQESETMARHYSRGASRKNVMTGIVKDLDAERNKRRSKSVKPS